MIRRSTWIMLGAFVLVVAAALVFQRAQERSAAEATPTPGLTYLFDVQDETLIGLRISDAQENSVAVQRDEGGEWTLLEPSGEPADQSRVESAVSQAGTLRILSTLDQTLDLNVIGLDAPSYQISVTLASGRRITALIGSQTPTGSGYYAKVEDGGPQQVVNKSSVDSLLELLTNPPIAPTPSPSPETTPAGTSTP
jgi:hypothetical protein